MDYRVKELDAQREVHLHSVDRRDMEIIKEHCAINRAAGAGNGKDGKWAMTCEGWVIWDWCIRQGMPDWKEFWRDRKMQDRFLNDPANAVWRIWEGKV